MPGRLLPLRPMTVGDVLDGAFRALRAAFGPILLVVVLILAPYHLLSSLLLDRLSPQGLDGGFGFGFGGPVDPEPVDFGELGAMVGATVLLALVGIVVNLLVASAVVALVHRADRGQDLDVGEAVRTAIGRFGSTLGATLLLLLGLSLVGLVGMVISIVLLFIPILGWAVLLVGGVAVMGLVAGVLSLVVPIAVTEGRGPIATLGRVFWVLRVRFWRVMGITLLVLLVVVLVTFGVSLAFGLLALAAGPLGWAVESIGSLLASIVQVPVASLAALLIYLDARVRYEGYDLEVRAGPAAPRV